MTEIDPRPWLCLEYMGTKSGHGTFDLGGTWTFTDNIAMVLGHNVYYNSDISSTVTVQVDNDYSLRGK